MSDLVSKVSAAKQKRSSADPMAHDEVLRSLRLLESSQEIAKVGGWEMDLRTRDVFWTRETYRILDLDPETFTPSETSYYSLFGKEASDQLSAALAKAQSDGEGYDLELEIESALGRRIHIRTTCKVTKVDDGKPIMLTGTFQDITAAKQVTLALRDRERELQALFEYASVGLARLSPSGDWMLANKPLARALGTTVHKLLLIPFVNHLRTEFRTLFYDRLRQLREDTVRSFELMAHVTKHSGDSIWVQIGAQGVYDGSGNLQFVVLMVADLSERIRVADKLLESEQFARATIDALDDAICVLEPKGDIVAVNRAWQGVGGDQQRKNPKRGVGANYLAVCRQTQGSTRPVALKIADSIQKLVEAPQPQPTSCEYSVLVDGEERYFSVQLSPFPENPPRRLVVAHIDITTRHRAERDMQHSQKQLRKLNRRIEGAREEESRRIAEMVHDQLGQQLTRLKMDIKGVENALEKLIEPAAEKALQRIMGAESLVDDTLATVRHIASDLRPVVLDKLGLFVALRQEIQEFAFRSGIRCDHSIPEGKPDFSDAIATAIYRIAQEALTNVIRHANAEHVTLEIQLDENVIVTEIHDDGKGFNPAAINGSSMGVMSMKERAKQLGGWVKLYPAEGGGTLVHVEIPLRTGDHEEVNP